MLDQTGMVQNPTLQGGQTLLWLAGLAPEPLPPDPRAAIENFLIHGNTNYIPKGATQILNAFDHPAAPTMMASVKLPENYMALPQPPKAQDHRHTIDTLMKDKMAHGKMKLKILTIFNDQPVEKEKTSQEKKKLHYPQPLSSELSGKWLAAFMKLKTA
ncbi:hypothetical protein BS47DRAFT_1369459 [Hydnum rufescens UP504]|uniref:Uncharacterized protein n=1 Tax=Hydnum rufescens UP504 TaxID=1448309 RepID=A0A9P6DLY7_9AGAM|nr:hypothetical protein BS47DRAFT_1369459 [Hydnum rufescens UP504]